MLGANNGRLEEAALASWLEELGMYAGMERCEGQMYFLIALSLRVDVLDELRECVRDDDEVDREWAGDDEEGRRGPPNGCKVSAERDETAG